MTVAVVVVGALLLAVASTHGRVKAQASSQAGTAAGSCEATVEGWTSPADVPSYLQWQPILEALASSDIAVVRRVNVGATTADRMKTQAAAGLSRAKDLKASRGDVAMAGAILDARDELIRLLPQGAFDDLQAVVSDRTAATAFRLPIAGKRIAVDSTSRCHVVADYKSEPHIVPEYVVWNIYLSSLASLAADNRLGDGSFPDKFIAGLRLGLMIQPASMIYLLNVASEETARVASLRTNGATDRDIDRAVTGFRSQLLRTLSPRDWVQVKKAVARIGVSYPFLPSW